MTDGRSLRVQWLAWRPFGQSVSIPGYGATFLAEFATLAASLLVLRLAARHWGPAGFGEYVLARRALTLIQLPILLNMGVALSRFVAISSGDDASSSRQTFLVATTGIAAVTSVAALAVLFLVATPAAALLFGDAQYAPLMRATAFALPGIALHGVAYGYFRGRLHLAAANTLQVVNLGVIPVAILLMPGISVTGAMRALAGGWIGVALLALAVPLARALKQRSGGVPGAVRTLLRYGLPRVPGEFALAALYSLPTTLAAHFGGVTAAGFVGLGVALLSAVGSVYAPLGQIVLPSVSAAAAGRDRDALRRGVWRLWFGCMATASVMLVILAVAAPLLIAAYVGPAFVPATPVARLLLLAGPGQVTYVVLRNVLDALDIRARNARNLVIALAVFVGMVLIAGRPDAVAAALCVAVTGLGALSLY
ncbi:MAG: lipopolysaccharide biosynthesis protein, partial [Gemmatimonadales bacterium]